MTSNCSVPSGPRQQITALFGLLVMMAFSVGAQSPPGVDVTVHATILFSGFRNAGRVNNIDVPTVAVLEAGQTATALGGTVRQTRIGLTVAHESVLGARLFGELDADFFGGQQPSGGGKTHPLLRVRRAYSELRWATATLLVGQEAPGLFGISPRSIAASGFPQLASAGNLWLWLPQIRFTKWSGSDPNRLRIGIEGSLLAPNAGTPADPFVTEPDLAEQSGRPTLEGRVVGRWRSAGREGEIGVGGHLGWLGTDDTRTTSRAFGVSAVAPFGSALEVRGEFFSGQALSGLGGGGIGQNTAGMRPVETTGGWIQAVVFPGAGIELGFSAGIDDPVDAVLGPSARYRNRAGAVNLTWRRAPAVAGLEMRRIVTDYRNPDPLTARATHLHLGMGIEF